MKLDRAENHLSTSDKNVANNSFNAEFFRDLFTPDSNANSGTKTGASRKLDKSDDTLVLTDIFDGVHFGGSPDRGPHTSDAEQKRKNTEQKETGSVRSDKVDSKNAGRVICEGDTSGHNKTHRYPKRS